MVYLKLPVTAVINRYPSSQGRGTPDVYINTDTITEVAYTPQDNYFRPYGIIRFSSGENLSVDRNEKVFWNNLLSIISSNSFKTITENFTYTTLHKSYGT